jgi:hypothetical protein
MDKCAELDEHVKFAQQWEEDVSPVILINIFHVKPEDGDRLIEAWGYKEAFNKYTSPEVQSKLLKYPDSAGMSPHLFRKVAVPGICVE